MASDPRSMVYILRCGDAPAVKIGVTVNLPARIRVLSEPLWEDLHPVRLLAGSYPEETVLHARFAHLRLRWEWFTYHEDMLGDLGLPDWVEPEWDDPEPVGLPDELTAAELGRMAPGVAARIVALRSWMIEEGHTVEEVARVCQVKVKTVVRWLYGSYPHNRVGANRRLLEMSGGKLAAALVFPTKGTRYPGSVERQQEKEAARQEARRVRAYPHGQPPADAARIAALFPNIRGAT